jgi:hypothetical protein
VDPEQIILFHVLAITFLPITIPGYHIVPAIKITDNGNFSIPA